MSNRMELPNRRINKTTIVSYLRADGGVSDFIVTYSFGPSVRGWGVRECFCTSPKVGSDMQALINDSCIAISLLLQCGMNITELAQAFGENRQEGAESGNAASPLGAIAREGAQIEADA